MRGLLRKVSAPEMFFVLDQWSSAPVAYSPIRPKSQIFNIWHDYALWIRNFIVMMKNPRILILRLGPMAHGHNPTKVPKFKIRHDGILSIGNFMLMIKHHFARFQLPGNLLKIKKNVLPIFVATRNFLFINSFVHLVTILKI
jgi:hypothetical protein